LSSAPWRDQNGRVHIESFWELAQQARPFALSLMRAVYDRYRCGKAISPLFFQTDYSGRPLGDFGTDPRAILPRSFPLTSNEG
jgi:hypothetical protein